MSRSCRCRPKRPVIVIVNPPVRRLLGLSAIGGSGGGEFPNRFQTTGLVGVNVRSSEFGRIFYDLITADPVIIPDRSGLALIRVSVQGSISPTDIIPGPYRIELVAYVDRDGSSNIAMISAQRLEITTEPVSFVFSRSPLNLNVQANDVISFGFIIYVPDPTVTIPSPSILLNVNDSTVTIGLP